MGAREEELRAAKYPEKHFRGASISHDPIITSDQDSS